MHKQNIHAFLLRFLLHVRAYSNDFRCSFWCGHLIWWSMRLMGSVHWNDYPIRYSIWWVQLGVQLGPSSPTCPGWKILHRMLFICLFILILVLLVSSRPTRCTLVSSGVLVRLATWFISYKRRNPFWVSSMCFPWPYHTHFFEYSLIVNILLHGNYGGQAIPPFQIGLK